MFRVSINSKTFWLKSGLTVLEACKYAGINVPRFCYHENLSVAGNCRMCLVEINGSPKPVASCAIPAVNNMQIFVDTPLVKKVRENILEFLLLNHPLDCPICDQGGECDLQDQTKLFGNDAGRFFLNRRGVEDKFCGPIIKTIMTRCIHCTRCVRYGSEITGVDFFGTLNRGHTTEISNYIQRFYASEVSGNVIDLCPVGALTSKPYVFRSRPWELRSVETVDLTDSLGVDTYVNFKESEVLRIIPKYSNDLKMSFISDKSRFIYEALKLNRIAGVYIKDDKLGLVRASWQSVLSRLNFNLNTFTFLISNDVSYESLSLLRSLGLRSKLGIKVLSYSRSNNPPRNIHFGGLLNSVSDLITNPFSHPQVCFLFSTNIKIESALINIKLRLKLINENLSIIGVGVNRLLNYPALIYNFGEISTLKVFSGKSVLFSKMLLTVRPLILLGENFFEGIACQNVVKFIKRLNPSSIILNITGNNSVENLRLFNIKPVCSKFLRNTKNIAAINLADHSLIHRVFDKYNFTNIVSFNTHGTELIRKSNFIFPTSMSGFEDGGIFFNLEQKPKKVRSILLNCIDSRSLYQILSCLYINYDIYKTFTPFVHEFLYESSSFLVTRGSSSMLVQILELLPVRELGYKVLGHPNIEDFYLTSLHSRNSTTLLLCSKEHLKLKTNFNVKILLFKKTWGEHTTIPGL